MHIIILRLFHFYLLNFSYKSDTVVLCRSHVTAVFVNVAFSKIKQLSEQSTGPQQLGVWVVVV